MRFRDDELRGIPVVTKGGEKVGKLAGFLVDASTHEVAQYAVKKSRLLSALLPDELLIHRSQVLSLDDEKMVVEDAAVGEKAAQAVRMSERAVGEAPGGAAMMKR